MTSEISLLQRKNFFGSKSGVAFLNFIEFLEGSWQMLPSAVCCRVEAPDTIQPKLKKEENTYRSQIL